MNVCSSLLKNLKRARYCFNIFLMKLYLYCFVFFFSWKDFHWILLNEFFEISFLISFSWIVFYFWITGILIELNRVPQSAEFRNILQPATVVLERNAGRKIWSFFVIVCKNERILRINNKIELTPLGNNADNNPANNVFRFAWFDRKRTVSL